MPRPDDRRRAGVLLHLSSLPARTVGQDARSFVDFLASCQMSVWQMLPVGPVDSFGSPYQGCSLHAGNRDFIDRDDLIDVGWLRAEHRASDNWLVSTFEGFKSVATTRERENFESFRIDNHYWLDDYVLFQGLRFTQTEDRWWQWPVEIRDRRPEAIDEVRRDIAPTLDLFCFEQYLFQEQWNRLKTYAHANGILLFGDMPIYPAHNSADVWANRSHFMLDVEGQPLFVGGVPPDAFSDSGQRWGNPVYDWSQIEVDGFRWWLDRLKSNFARFDCLRVDHFRGLVACWHIPASSNSAVQGEWFPVPGRKLLGVLEEHFGSLPLIAEDLGLITEDVECLRDEFGLPGMRILQFAVDSDADNPHWPHNYPHHCVAFTGTHDNNTMLGWLGHLGVQRRAMVMDYSGQPSEPMPWPLLRLTMASVAELAILPMQDLLSLSSGARMNTPGTTGGNWFWRFKWKDLDKGLWRRIANMVSLYNRAPLN